jgi:hypothetical protein
MVLLGLVLLSGAWTLRFFVAAIVRLHGASPWHPFSGSGSLVAAIVRLHGASPWHPVSSCASLVAASVRLHGANPWHPSQVASLLASEREIPGPARRAFCLSHTQKPCARYFTGLPSASITLTSPMFNSRIPFSIFSLSPTITHTRLSGRTTFTAASFRLVTVKAFTFPA